MRNKSSLLMIACTILFFLSINFSEAATWYVRTSGNDANTGNSVGTAKLTIQAMVNAGSVANGDIIDIGAGTFVEQVVINDKSLTLQGAGLGSTVIQAPTWAGMTTYTESTLLYWNVTNIAAVSLPTNQFKPVIFVNAASNSYTTNIYGITVNGNTAAPAAPGVLFVGIMYKNSQGTVGASTTNYPVRVHSVNGADGINENTVFGFGIMCIGTANPLIQYSTFESNQNSSIASIGRSLSSTLVSQMPNPTVRDNTISGSSMTNTAWHTGIMTAYGGRVTAQRNIIRGHRNTTEDRTGGIHIYDGRTALIGSNSVKADGNTITDNDWGINVIVTNSIISTPSSYTIKNNSIVYNGNGGSGLTCSGVATTSGCVRYENTTTTASRSLSLAGNAWGNSDPLNNGYTYDATPPGAATDAFYGVTAGDVMAITSPLFSVAEFVDPSYTEETSGWGYSAFNTIQQAVDAAGNPDTIKVAMGTYAENVCVFTKKNVAIIGDSMATCGSGNKPIINPASGNAMHIFTLGAGAALATDNITVNGFFFDQEGTQRVGILTTGWDNTDAASNNPPTSVEVRNSCFKDYATQTADGTPAASAAMATEEYPFNNTTRQSYGNNVSPATVDPTDIDAQANNNFNYLGVSTSPSFKLWDKTDEYIAQGSVAYNAATILQTNLIIVFCGDDLNVALGALGSGPVTVYLQGDCIYKNNTLDINGPFEIRVDYTGRVNLPPLVVAPNGINYNAPAAGLSWSTDCHVDAGPGIRFVTNSTMLPLAANLTNGHQPSGTIANASATYMKTLTPLNYTAGFDYQTTNYGLDRPANITVVGSNNFALQDAIRDIADTNGYAGTVTLANAAAFNTALTLQKRIRFAVTGAGTATNASTITLMNKVLPNGPDCATTANTSALDDILDTRVTSGSFTSPSVFVGVAASATPTDWADNTDTTNTIQQGLVFTAANGTTTVNYRGDYTAQAPTMTRSNVTLTSDDAANFVGGNSGAGGPLTSITLNGSGNCASMSDIVRFDVPVIFMANVTDCIQTALGTATNQDDEGVGNDNGAGVAVPAGATPRVGTVTFNVGGAISPSQPITLEKDVVFNGLNATPNTNNNTLTMNLGAYRTVGGNISLSDNFCNNIVQATQAAGSGYTGIPDIQDAINLTCLNGTLNIGTTAAATTWGAGTDTYNRDNTLDSSIIVQGTNTTSACANDPAFIIDATTAWPVNAGRSANTSTFSGFTTTNPVFTIASGVNSVTIQGFNFTGLTQGAANAVIYAAGTGANVNNTIAINSNVYTGSSELFIKSAGSGVASTYHTGWTIDCNRMVPASAMSSNYAIELIDHNGVTVNRNYYDGTGSSSGNYPFAFRGFGGAGANNITANVVTNATGGAALWIGQTGSSNAVGNVTITRNRFRNSANDGIEFSFPENFVAPISVTNNFLNTNAGTGVYLNASTAITHQHFSINNNSFENSLNGIYYVVTYNGTVCQINARGNWWEHASGPTNSFNPLNPTPCTATSFGDIIVQNGTCSSGDQSMVSYIPWWTIGTDANAALDGWQEPAAVNALARVVRTSSAGVWLENYANINNAVDDIDANNQKVIAIQGVFGWLPVSGMGDDWGEYFSEQVTYSNAFTGNEIRGVTVKAWDCTNSIMETWHTYLATTGNVTAPVPSGDIVHAPAAPISGNEQTGFFIDGQTATNTDNTTIRNFRVQGFSSTGTPMGTASPGGKAIMFDRVTNPSVDACWIEGSVLGGSTRGSVGIYLDRCTGGLLTSNVIGTNQAISSSSGSNAGVGIALGDASQTTQTFGPNTVGQNAATAIASAMGLGITSGGNIVRNCERVGITAGHGAALAGSMGATTVIQYNTIQGIRDAVGTGGVVAIAGIHADATAGDLRINNNTIGGKGLTTQNDNNVDIELASNTFTLSASSTNNVIRDSAQVVDGENYTVGSVSGGTRATELRTFFNPASSNTFSHAAILTTDDNEPYDFANTMIRDNDIVPIGGTVRIYRQIATPLANTNTVYNAAGGSETFNNVVEVRENAGWTIGEIDQYYAENLSFQSTTGLVHQLILGPKTANTLDPTSAHIISSTGPGTGTAITAAGRENKYLRGGLMLHAIGNGLYGSISTGTAADNKGDVYLQRTASGTDAGFVQFAYHSATFGSQTAVTGTGTETGGTANANANKPTIIKAGLDDANDDSHTAGTSNQNRRTGVFQAGNGTTFTKPTEPVAGLGVDGMTAFPNPSNGGIVNVQFSVPVDAMVRVALYDALGRKVTDLKEGSLSVGVYNTEFDVNNLPSGTYTVRMEYDYSVKTVQVHVIK